METKYFIKGPIPLWWLTIANRLGGCTTAVAMLLWFYDGIYEGQSFQLTWRLDDVTGISRQSRQKALKKLEAAGLIELNIRHGSYPIVMIIKTPRDKDEPIGGMGGSRV
jgi:hypothetical protein